jgi:cysteinyl-tRNA synthetase
MGHARTYLGFDIIRRILEDYFQFDVTYVVNVTDIDDKIIKKANLMYLNKLLSTVSKLTLKEESKQSFEKIKNIVDEDALKAPQQLKLKDLVVLIEDLKEATKDVLTKEQMEEQPDFFGVARYFEDLYWEDMLSINVRRPTVITRVTEYVPEIIKFIEEIIKNGFAYVSNGSVYFDTQKYHESENHIYAKLEPSAMSDVERRTEGEGEWIKQNKVEEKKSKNDFALWKKSAKGEPSWKSPFGEAGRPGWHIECSAMASDILGKTLDVHTGGVDLKFPHHDNELAQSEAHFDHDQWVNYFLHAGHLHIQGLKMSKSLKNFITIQGALEIFTSRQIRWLFVLHNFNDPMDYSDETMKEAQYHDKLFNEFFQNMKVKLRDLKSTSEHWTPSDHKLHKSLKQLKSDVHEALSDNFNTPEVVKLIAEFIKSVYIYVEQEGVKFSLINEISMFVMKMMKVFGFESDSFGYSTGSGQDFESELKPIMDIFVTFRENVRDQSKKNKDQHLLSLSDELRDDLLPEVGIRLEDIGAGKSVWKLDDKATLLKERQFKKDQEAAIALQKEKAKKEQEEKELKKLEASKINPKEMFSLNEYKDLFSTFDESGLPLKLKNGEDVPKAQIKKLKKVQEKQEKLFKEYLEKQK